ncbi:MAG: WYL domain-containing protein [Clostridia bacterium]|nr:WYL domain-containing protein [Clostridia bacterium]
MAFNELIKNFSRIRDYMREFYVYGFKSRDEYDKKSARSYDDERRRIESWLGDYMSFRTTPDGKNVFLSIDSRLTRHDPLYAAWKACSFTDGDITLHFILFDILHSSDVSLTLKEITEKIDGYLSGFNEPKTFDESTVRKKLKEYANDGLIVAAKHGKTVFYRRESDTPLPSSDVLDFFSEAAPCGVIGSFLLDKVKPHKECFAFKHHYITNALDSDILCTAFCAMQEKRTVVIKNLGKRDSEPAFFKAVPLRIFISTQNGRQYLVGYRTDQSKFSAFRLDYILDIEIGEVYKNFDALREKLERIQKHMWGVTLRRNENDTEHVEFTVTFGDNEEYIYRRLLREKRCGTVERIDKNTAKFSADVYDCAEMKPWIRTFICRITDIKFSNKDLEREFLSDIHSMYEMYGLEGGDDDAV